MYARDFTRASKDYRGRRHTVNQRNYFGTIFKDDDAALSSHVILKHPMGELQVCVFFLYSYFSWLLLSYENVNFILPLLPFQFFFSFVLNENLERQVSGWFFLYF